MECHDGSFDPGYRKIALYEDDGEYQHASIQMPNGAWRSKMGTARSSNTVARSRFPVGRTAKSIASCADRLARKGYDPRQARC